MFKENELIAQRYLVLAEIGRGGMGVVLKVQDMKTRDMLALKYCATSDGDSARRFDREVRIMLSITHPHVMAVLDANMQNKPPFFTMPIAQHSIAAEIPMPEDRALETIKQVCLGVQAIHKATGTHRDIKPDNAMRMQNGTVVVSDLGLVKLDPRDTTPLTQTAAFIGTRAYCAPEQLIPGGSREADARTDVYQLGKTLYQLITGEPPALIDRTKLPAALGYIIERATQQHPDQRYQSVGELLDAIENYVLAKSPGADPARTLEVALQQARGLAQNGEYRQDNLETILNVLLRFTDDNEVFIEQFERISRQLLGVIARAVPDLLLPVMQAYCHAVDTEIGKYAFEHAEKVAGKMKAVFLAADQAALKAIAVKTTLIAAVELNRYAAMDVLDEMLISVARPEDAIAIADALRDKIGLYKGIADRLPRTKLHGVLQEIHQEATSHG